MNIDFELLQKRHRDLISNYYLAINKVSYMPIFGPKNGITHLLKEPNSAKNLFVLRPLVKLFTEWHI